MEPLELEEPEPDAETDEGVPLTSAAASHRAAAPRAARRPDAARIAADDGRDAEGRPRPGGGRGVARDVAARGSRPSPPARAPLADARRDHTRHRGPRRRPVRCARAAPPRRDAAVPRRGEDRAATETRVPAPEAATPPRGRVATTPRRDGLETQHARSRGRGRASAGRGTRECVAARGRAATPSTGVKIAPPLAARADVDADAATSRRPRPRTGDTIRVPRRRCAPRRPVRPTHALRFCLEEEEEEDL